MTPNIINEFGASLRDDARVVIYDRHMFIELAIGHKTKIIPISFKLTYFDAMPFHQLAFLSR